MMFKFTLSSVLLLIYVTTINCSDSFSVIDTNDEYQLTERKHESNKHLEHEFSIENFRVEHGKEKSLFGFSLTKSNLSNKNGFSGCFILDDSFLEETRTPMIIFRIDLANKKVQINSSKSTPKFWILENESLDKSFNESKSVIESLTLNKVKSDEKYSYYNFKFYMITGDNSEGKYDFNLHKCSRTKRSVSNVVRRNYVEARFRKNAFIPFIGLSCCFLIMGISFVYVLKTCKYPIHKIHHLMTEVVFLKAFLFAVFAFEFYKTNYMIQQHDFLWYGLEFLLYLTKVFSLCLCCMMLYEAYNFFKSIFGHKERNFLTIVLSIQANLWITLHIYMFFMAHSSFSNKVFLVILTFDMLSALVMGVYFLIRKKIDRSQKAAENLKKFQLFRFIYSMVALFFYFKVIFMRLLLVIEVSYEICLVLEDVCAIMFFAIIFYNCQPKYLCALITLSNGGEALDVINDDSKKETNEDSRKE